MLENKNNQEPKEVKVDIVGEGGIDKLFGNETKENNEDSDKE